MEPTSYSADSALAEALARLKYVEDENIALRSRVDQLTKDTNRPGAGRLAGSSAGSELDALKKQNDELMHVNNQWDLEFKDLEETFRKYRIDSQQAQGENHSLISTLKDEKEHLKEKNLELQIDIRRRDQEIAGLKAKVKSLEEEIRKIGGGIHQPIVSQRRLKELEEESQMLRQQLKMYQDDFNAERRDRERMNEERESASIRYEAEVTSLKLQLERCRNELAHYTAEANRLSQQLRLKNQCEEEQYKKHLESRGYITRSPSGHLPPLDPFVEIDVEDPPNRGKSASPRLLTRGVDIVQAYGNSQPAQGHPAPPQRALSNSSERSRSPILMNGAEVNRSMYAGPSVTGYNGYLHPENSRENGFTPSIPPSMSNGAASKTPYPQARHNGYSANETNERLVNGLSKEHDIINGDVPVINGIDTNRPVYQEHVIPRSSVPPMETKGRYSCPRCERKFVKKTDCTEHKKRCMV